MPSQAKLMCVLFPFQPPKAMKQTINQVKTIEIIADDILSLFQQIGKEAQAKGLTEEILEELLADES